MARTRGFVAGDPTAWTAISWADKDLEKKRRKKPVEGREKRKVYKTMQKRGEGPQTQI